MAVISNVFDSPPTIASAESRSDHDVSFQTLVIIIIIITKMVKNSILRIYATWKYITIISGGTFYSYKQKY